MSDEPLTEAVVDTQEAPKLAYAWSEEGQKTHCAWPEVTEDRRRPHWHGLVAGGVYLAVGAATATVVGLLVGHHEDKAPVPTHVPSSGTVAQGEATVAPSSTPPVRRDPPPRDDRFIADLINHDAQITQNRVAINNAHAVCDNLAKGQSRPDIENRIREATDGYTAIRAAIFVTLAVDYYCPQQG